MFKKNGMTVVLRIICKTHMEAAKMPNETIQIIFLVLLNAYVWGG